MIQLYFLSILFNAFTGYLLIAGEDTERETIEGGMKFSPDNSVFRLILGILAAATGVLKLLSPIGKIPILGDLVPALAGAAAGFILIFGYYREHSTAAGEGDIDRLGEILIRYKKAAGILLLASSALHFLFPDALFL